MTKNDCLLKLKAFIYQKTGIYLAHKEELEYISNKEFWMKFSKLISQKNWDMGLRDTQGLLIGLWQAKHGFYRKYKPRNK